MGVSTLVRQCIFLLSTLYISVLLHLLRSLNIKRKIFFLLFFISFLFFFLNFNFSFRGNSSFGSSSSNNSIIDLSARVHHHLVYSMFQFFIRPCIVSDRTLYHTQHIYIYIYMLVAGSFCSSFSLTPWCLDSSIVGLNFHFVFIFSLLSLSQVSQ